MRSLSSGALLTENGLRQEQAGPRTSWQSRLSPREEEIAGLVARGFINKEIAAELGISRWTVATHLRRIYDKLDVRTRGAMVAKLMQVGMLHLSHF